MLRSVRYESDSGSWRPGTTASRRLSWRRPPGSLVLAFDAEQLGGLLAGADLAVGPAEQQGDTDADGEPGDRAEQRPADA